MHFVYILGNKGSKWYIGETNSLERRMKQHEKLHPGYRLIYYEAYHEKERATKREYQLKQYAGAWRALKKRLQD